MAKFNYAHLEFLNENVNFNFSRLFKLLNLIMEQNLILKKSNISLILDPVKNGKDRKIER